MVCVEHRAQMTKNPFFQFMGSTTKKEPEFDVYDLSEIIVMDKKDYALYTKEAEISALKAGGVQHENF